MLSLRRLCFIVLMVAGLGGIFLIYNMNETRQASVGIKSSYAPEREFTETRELSSGEKPRVFLLGDSADDLYGKIYDNVRQYCLDIHLTVIAGETFPTDSVTERDLVIFCDAAISRRADLTKLRQFIDGGGRVLLAAGLAEGDGDADVWPLLGIREKKDRQDCRDLLFEKPLLPVQPKRAVYGGDSGSVRIAVDDDTSVYIREEKTDIPILYTYAYGKGFACLLNGTFLADARCLGLLSGAIGTLLPDFVYPVFGVKAIFLDDFPMASSADNAFCMKVYGYSADGFVKDVVWPAFQGVSLRTGTPFTTGILAIASSDQRFLDVNSSLFASIGKSVLQFGGELVYRADCTKGGNVYYHHALIERFSEIFTSYTVQGLEMENDHFSAEMLNVPGADIRFVRGLLESRDMRLSWENGCTVFPRATAGNSMEDGNLFAICSVLASYGMVSHVFDVGALIVKDGSSASWDLDKEQLGILEADVLDQTRWLEGRTLSQVAHDVKSYQQMDYDWSRDGSRVEINCSGIAKGQAFFYRTDAPITNAEGLTYQNAGNGYYLLRLQGNRGVITLREAK